MNGLALDFEHPQDAVAAVRLLQKEGIEKLDFYCPFHLDEVEELFPRKAHRVSYAVFVLACCGALSAYTLQYLSAVHWYPFQVAGTPLHSGLAFLPITFEGTVLIGAATAFFSSLLFGGLPKFHHPVFDLPGFERASQDRFFVVVNQPVPDALLKHWRSENRVVVHEF